MDYESLIFKNTKHKFPCINIYITNLRYHNIPKECIIDEIDRLNKVALCEDPMTFSQRIGIAIISSINPLGPLGFIIGYIATSDKCPTEYRKTEQRYKRFISKL